MSDVNLTDREYKYGFYTDIETEEFPKGLNEDIIRMISAKKKNPNGYSSIDSRLSSLAQNDRAHLGASRLSQDRF